MIPGTYQLHPVSAGRLFIRGAVAQPQGYSHTKEQVDALSRAAAVIGVVELPKSVDVERMHDVRLNDALWMDVERSIQPRGLNWGVSEIRTATLDDLLRSLQFSRGPIADAFEVFVRATHLEHDKPGMRWAYVAGVIARRPEEFAKDGIYELNGTKGATLVREGSFPGENLGSIVRMPFWGPGGRFGLTTSMEPGIYPSWLEDERKRQVRSGREPMFLEFVREMEIRLPLGLFYDAERYEARERLSREVVKRLMEMQSAAAPADTGAPPQPEFPVRRPRP